MLTPFPGTIDFAKWEGSESARAAVNGVPLSRYSVIPCAEPPKVYSPHPLMSADDIRRRTQDVWGRFDSLAAIWQRSDCVRTIRSVESNRLAIRVVT